MRPSRGHSRGGSTRKLRDGPACETYAAIRAALSLAIPEARTIPIIYGGSVSPAGAGALLEQPLVDGLFVGRQALDPRVFAEIAHTPATRSDPQRR